MPQFTRNIKVKLNQNEVTYTFTGNAFEKIHSRIQDKTRITEVEDALAKIIVRHLVDIKEYNYTNIQLCKLDDETEENLNLICIDAKNDIRKPDVTIAIISRELEESYPINLSLEKFEQNALKSDHDKPKTQVKGFFIDYHLAPPLPEKINPISQNMLARCNTIKDQCQEELKYYELITNEKFIEMQNAFKKEISMHENEILAYNVKVNLIDHTKRILIWIIEQLTLLTNLDQEKSLFGSVQKIFSSDSSVLNHEDLMIKRLSELIGLLNKSPKLKSIHMNKQIDRIIAEANDFVRQYLIKNNCVNLFDGIELVSTRRSGNKISFELDRIILSHESNEENILNTHIGSIEHKHKTIIEKYEKLKKEYYKIRLEFITNKHNEIKNQLSELIDLINMIEAYDIVKLDETPYSKLEIEKKYNEILVNLTFDSVPRDFGKLNAVEEWLKTSAEAIQQNYISDKNAFDEYLKQSKEAIITTIKNCQNNWMNTIVKLKEANLSDTDINDSVEKGVRLCSDLESAENQLNKPLKINELKVLIKHINNSVKSQNSNIELISQKIIEQNSVKIEKEVSNNDVSEKLIFDDTKDKQIAQETNSNLKELDPQLFNYTERSKSNEKNTGKYIGATVGLLIAGAFVLTVAIIGLTGGLAVIPAAFAAIGAVTLKAGALVGVTSVTTATIIGTSFVSVTGGALLSTIGSIVGGTINKIANKFKSNRSKKLGADTSYIDQNLNMSASTEKSELGTKENPKLENSKEKPKQVIVEVVVKQDAVKNPEVKPEENPAEDLEEKSEETIEESSVLKLEEISKEELKENINEEPEEDLEEESESKDDLAHQILLKTLDDFESWEQEQTCASVPDKNDETTNPDQNSPPPPDSPVITTFGQNIKCSSSPARSPNTGKKL